MAGERDLSPVSIQTQSLALRALRKRKPQETQSFALATMIGCLPTQTIAFEWKPGLSCVPRDYCVYMKRSEKERTHVTVVDDGCCAHQHDHHIDLC